MFMGGWDEDSDGCFAVYKEMARIFQLKSMDKLESVPIILDVQALRLFSERDQSDRITPKLPNASEGIMIALKRKVVYRPLVKR